MSPAENELADALRSLPHGPEFRFVDRLTALQPGTEGRGEYTVRGDEPFLKGHFPGAPLFPGVLLVEAGAQLAGIVAQSVHRNGRGSELKLTALRQVKITGSAVPGDVIALRAKILGKLGGLIQAEAEASVSGQIVMTAQLTLSGG